MASTPGDPPIASPEWNFLCFCPMQFETLALHLYIFESQAGRPTHLTATLHDKAGEYDGDPIIGVDHDLEWDYSSSVRTLTGGRLRSDVRRVGKECVSTFRSRVSPSH